MQRFAISINTKHLMMPTTVIAVLLLWFSCAIAEINIKTSKTTLELGETLDIRLSSNQGKNIALNQLQPLLQHFDVIGQSQSNQYQNVNGKVSNTFSLNLRLTAKKEGTFTIPAMSINGELSRPFTITVSANKAVQPTGSSAKNFELIGFVDTPVTYVGAEVIYTFQLLYQHRILKGQISQPQIPGIQIKTIAKQKRSQTVRNNQRYDVLEWRYAFIPKRSENLKIPSLFFEGNVSTPLGQRRIRINTQEITVFVKPRPISWPANNDWLPVKSLSLWEKWQPAANQWQVGNPVSRTVEIEALGVEPSQIGNIDIGRSPLVSTYPQQPVRNLKLTPNGHQAKVTFAVDYIATSATRLTLPAIQIPWWDVKTNTLRYASLPAREIQVIPNNNLSNDPNPPPLVAPIVLQQNTPQPSDLSNQSPALQVGGLNQMALLGLLVVYTFMTVLLTLAYQRYRHKKRYQPSNHQPKHTLTQQIQQSYKKQDFQQLKHLLLLGYRQYQPMFNDAVKQQWRKQLHQLSINNFVTKEYLDELINHIKVAEQPVKTVKGELPQLYPN